MYTESLIRDGHGQLLGRTTTNSETGDAVARDTSGRILGHTSRSFRNTRDSQGKVVSNNLSDASILFQHKA